MGSKKSRPAEQGWWSEYVFVIVIVLAVVVTAIVYIVGALKG